MVLQLFALILPQIFPNKFTIKLSKAIYLCILFYWKDIYKDFGFRAVIDPYKDFAQAVESYGTDDKFFGLISFDEGSERGSDLL